MEEESRKRNAFLYFAAAAVNMGSFACGTAFAWSSPVIPKLNSAADLGDNPLLVPITPGEESWIASLISLGASVGPFVGGYGADKIGRRKTMILSMVPIIVSFLMTAFASDLGIFYVARFMVGLSCGVILTVTPMYMGEIAEIHNRGMLGCLMGGFVTVGYLYTFSMGPYVSITWLSLASTIGPAICLVLLIFIPESPYYLVAQNRQSDAKKSLLKLRYNDRDIVDKELLQISATIKESFASNAGIIDIFKNKVSSKGLLITVGLMILQQVSAITIIVFYMHSIFQSSGTTISPDIATIIVAVIQCVGSTSASLFVDKFGRKILIYVSTVGSSCTLTSLGVYFYLNDNGHDVSSLFWLPITSLVVYIALYNVGLGPIPYAIIGEVFSPHVKSAAAALTVSSCFLMSFGTSKVFPLLIDLMGNGPTFWLFGVCTASGLIFTYRVVPETKGKTFNEIQYKLNN